MSIRYRLAGVLAVVVLPLVVGVAVILAVLLPSRLAAVQRHDLDVAAQVIGASTTYECGALGYRTQLIALDIANGHSPAEVLAAQRGNRTDADSYDVVRVGADQPVVRGDLGGNDPLVLPAPRCSQDPGAIDRTRQGTPVIVEQATVTTDAGPITVVSVERITPDWVRAAKTQASLDAIHITLFCPSGSTSASSSQDVVYRELPAAKGRPCVIRAGEADVAGDRYRTWSMIALLATLGIAMGLILWLANELTSPIRALSDAARRATAGDRDVRVAMARRDEIGELGRDFDAMVTELHGLITQAESGRDALRTTARRLGDILQRTHDLDGMLTALTALGETTAGATCGSVWMTEGQALRLRSVHPIGSGRPDVRRLGEDGGLPIAAATTLATQTSTDAAIEPGSVLHGRMVAVPLVSGERVLGVLVLERPATAPAFDDAEVENLELALGSAGIAVDNAMLHRAVQRQSVVDPLTGVGNLRSLTTTVTREIERGKRFSRSVAVMIVDIDDFRRLNDELGPSVGDGVLKALAEELSSHVRSVDSVARYGGEEFAVVCPELGPDNAQRAAQRLVDGVRARTLDVLGIEVRLTVSVGIACYPVNGLTALELIESADRAMLEAKALGRDRAVTADPSW